MPAGAAAQPEIFTTAVVKKQEYVGGQLVLALERAYAELRRIHERGVIVQEYKTKTGVIGHIPDAVIVIASASTKYGHFAHSKWTKRGSEDPLAEIMISAEGLRRSPRDVLGTLVHEAVHGICHNAGVQDVSDSGRFHNQAFKRTAEEIGLIVHEPVKRLGHTNTELPEGELQGLIDELTPRLIAYREFDVVGHSLPAGGRELSLRCRCPRKIRVYEGVIGQGPVYCGICGDQFE